MTSVVATAPGRVNLIGEHTDYNDGFVLPAPIPQRAHATLRTRDDRRVIVASRELGERVEYELGDERRRGSWIDYVAGCTAILRAAGHQLRGFELALASDVPLGSGLSSSAALEVAVLRALRRVFALAITDVELALLGQRAENDFVGAPVGAMDQLAASLGRAGEALFIDIRELAATRSIPLPAADLIVIASGIRHDHAAGDYRTRRAECTEAARLLGVRSLREVTLADLPRVATLPAPLDRRVRHVVTENARVLAAVAALERDDLASLGELFAQSHASQRDDYEVSIPAIDRLVELAASESGVHGARLTGGGFGGSIVAFAATGRGPVAAAHIAERYGPGAEVLVAGQVSCDPS